MVTPTNWVNELPKAAQDFLSDKRLEEVECIVADMPGIARGKAMPAAKFARTEQMFLPDSIFYQTITGGWADFGGEDRFTDPDMVLTPDFSTAMASPWAADTTLQIIHNVCDQSGRPVPFAPRNVLRYVVDKFAEMGFKPIVAPELEFYIVAQNTDPSQPIVPPIGRSGRRVAASQAYSMSAVDEYGPIIDDIYDFAEAMGLEIDTIIHEGGAGQIEINLPHGNPIELADQVFYFKRLIREAALRNNCYATFMAKPMQDQPGSAMHIHHSVVDIKTGKNIFSNPDGSESDAFFHFIAGLQNHLPAAIAVIAPYVNSYRRYVPDFAAPVNLEWGRDNRTTGLRVPISNSEGRRIENRLAGMDCNPYLGLAASLACGLLGLKDAQKPRDQFMGNSYIIDDALPSSLREALLLFDESKALQSALSPDFCKVYSAIKWAEQEEFLQVISPWEREHLLINV
ncbi:MAG: glutamine synthetase family protein [Rhodobacterales bacterium]|jgi:glutamine synthetase|nr:glutamine synthetase [Rhodobacter sp.]